MIFGNVLFFEGCTIRYALKEIGENYRKLLRKIGIDFIEVDEICCGFPLLSSGALKEFEKQREKIGRILKEYWIKRVITPCPACACVFKKITRAEHVVEVFYKYIKKKKPKKIDGKVYVFYPCHLTRYLDLGDMFLKLLEMVFEEIFDPEDKKCCGGGGGLRTNFPDISKEIARRRIYEAKSSKADFMVTCCPLCYIQLKEVGGIEVLELSEVLLKVI